MRDVGETPKVYIFPDYAAYAAGLDDFGDLGDVVLVLLDELDKVPGKREPLGETAGLQAQDRALSM